MPTADYQAGCGGERRSRSGSPLLGVEDHTADGAEAEDKSTEELLKDAEKAFGEIFSVQAPRDILAGFWSGIQCVLSGVAIGIAGVIAQPIEGMKEAGCLGCFKGLALGIFTGLFFSITGLCTGAFQALRGTLATPRALCMASKGWQWDASRGQWAEPEAYSLPEEAAHVLHGATEEEDEEDGRLRRPVVDTYYYEQLSLTSAATQQEIRRAYFLQSKRWHPDKTSDSGAKERFQAISEAYQVLSDPERRRAYDQQGRQGAGEGFVDARIFFSVLLGVDALEPYIGRIRLAETFGDALFGGLGAAGAGDEGGATPEPEPQPQDAEKAQRRQVRRQVLLAVALAERLDARGGAEGAGDAFHGKALEEGRGLLKDPSIGRFLAEIGWVYRNRADLHLARAGSALGAYGPRSLGLRLRRSSRETAQQATTAKLAIRSYLKLRSIVHKADELDTAAADGEEAALPASISSALPTFMETFWSLTSHDITGTVDKVVTRVLEDASVNEVSQRLRAEGLRELGGAFMEAAREASVLQVAATPEVGPSSAEASAASPRGSSASSATQEDERKRKRFEEAFIASLGSPGSPTQHH